ncbi:MAG: Chromosome partition protein Smc [Chlamydiae bacterium]|nr:Chromosome partition protein Smc [Chlamydiota bacterium]
MSTSEALPLLNHSSQTFIEVQASYRKGWTIGGVINTGGVLLASATAIYVGVTNDWKKAAWPLGIAIVFGGNAAHNWYGLFRTRVHSISSTEMETTEGLISLADFRDQQANFSAQKSAFISSLTEIAEALEKKENLSAKKDYSLWERIQSAIAPLIKTPKPVPAVDPHASLNATLKAALTHVQEANSPLEKEFEKTPIDPEKLGPRILPEITVVECQQLWDDLDNALRMHEALRLVKQMGASFTEIQQSLVPLLNRFNIKPRDVVSRKAPEKFESSSLDNQWHILTSFITAISDAAQPSLLPLITDREIELQEKHAKIEELEAAVAKQKKQAEKDKKKSLEQKTMILSFQGVIGKNTKQIEASQKELAAAKEQHASEKGELQGLLKAAQTNVERLEKELTQANQKHEGVPQELADAKIEKARLEAALEAREKDHANEIEQLSAQLKSANSEKGRLSSELEEAKGKWEQYKNQVVEGGKKFEQKESQIEALQRTVNQKDEILRKEQVERKDHAKWIEKIKNSLDQAYQGFSVVSPSKDAIKTIQLPEATHPFFDLVSSVNTLIQTLSQTPSGYFSGSSAPTTPVKNVSFEIQSEEE